MKNTWIVLILFAWSAVAAASDADNPIRLNTLGFLPDAKKCASVAAPCAEFTVVRVTDGDRVLSGKVGEMVENADTGERLATADFSSLRDPGVFYLDVPGVGHSPEFSIGADVYNQPFQVVTRGMYLWRCGTAVTGTHNDQTFHHDACHLDDAWLDAITGEHVKKEATRGWHDAGDYNKYVVNAGVTVGCMLRAWEDFPAIHAVKLDLPESGGAIPDFLAELQWETDWLLTMQAPDGSVYHKLSTKSFGGFILPEKEKAERFFVPWSSAATADFVAMLAAASRAFRPYDVAYADRCLAAATASDAFLKAHPENHNADQKGFSTGGYGTSDPDDRLWAAAEIWETTGNAEALHDLEQRIEKLGGKVDRNWDWGNVNNLGLFTYVLSKRPGRSDALVEKVRASVLATADEIVEASRHHGYERPMGTAYYWGCNGTVARQVLNLQTAQRLAPKADYREVSLAALNYLFGRNFHGRSYVTGLGSRPPMNPHDRRSGADNVTDPWPGYLVGGPNPRAINWQDVQADYRTNEIAINWNGALIYALAAFVETDGR